MEKPSALQVCKYVVEEIEPVRSDIMYDIVMQYYQHMSKKIGFPAFKEDVLKSNGYLYCPTLNEFLNSSSSVKMGVTSEHFSKVSSYSFSPQEKDILERCIVSKIGEKRYRKHLEKHASKGKPKFAQSKPQKQTTKTNGNNSYRIPWTSIEKPNNKDYTQIPNKKTVDRKANDSDTVNYILGLERQQKASHGAGRQAEAMVKGVIAKNKASDIAHWILSHDRKCTYHELLGMMFYTYRHALQILNKDASQLRYELFENKFQISANGHWIAYEDIDNAYAKYQNGFIPKYNSVLPKFDAQTQSILNESYQITNNISKANFTSFIKSSPAWKNASIKKTPELKREDIYL